MRSEHLREFDIGARILRMPIYEYRCQTCGRKQSVFWRSLSTVNEASLKCEQCSSRKLSRLMSKVRVVRGSTDGNGSTAGADDAMMNEMAGLDENDPRALAGFMRKMAQESGEDMGPEFDEVVGRLEKGEDPEKIEQSMGDLFGGDEMGGPGMGSMGGMMDDDYGGPPAPEASAEKAEETKDKATTAKKRTMAMRSKAKTKRSPAPGKRTKKKS
jgi:putative FmdB family regulatory protein